MLSPFSGPCGTLRKRPRAFRVPATLRACRSLRNPPSLQSPGAAVLPSAPSQAPSLPSTLRLPFAPPGHPVPPSLSESYPDLSGWTDLHPQPATNAVRQHFGNPAGRSSRYKGRRITPARYPARPFLSLPSTPGHPPFPLPDDRILTPWPSAPIAPEQARVPARRSW